MSIIIEMRKKKSKVKMRKRKQEMLIEEYRRIEDNEIG